MNQVEGVRLPDEEIRRVWPGAIDIDNPYLTQPRIEAELLKGSYEVADAQTRHLIELLINELTVAIATSTKPSEQIKAVYKLFKKWEALKKGE